MVVGLLAGALVAYVILNDGRWPLNRASEQETSASAEQGGGSSSEDARIPKDGAKSAKNSAGGSESPADGESTSSKSPRHKDSAVAERAGYLPPLSALASPPDWSELDRWQRRITQSDFRDMLENVYTVSPVWRAYFYIGEKDVLIETGIPDKPYRLRFATPGKERVNPRKWRKPGEMGSAPEGKPLYGVKIAIDPGHLGGQWGKMEARWFQIGEQTPVQEGDMTLLVAKLLLPRLKALGAEVTLVRENAEPVTNMRPETILTTLNDTDADSPAQLAQKLFYRTSEIRARADLVNEVIEPDLVLCLHFNAEAWGDPSNPTLVNRHHFHLILNGAYTDDELAMADQRHQMLRRMLQGTHQEEVALGKAMAEAFVEKTQLPPYLYEVNSKSALNVDGNPYLWARNLLANRLYDAPVVFLEPYVMNSHTDHERIQAGDYEGERVVGGKAQPSIFREYADAVTQGLEDYYREARPES